MTARPLYFRPANRRPQRPVPSQKNQRTGLVAMALSYHMERHFCLDLALLWRICRGVAVVSYFAAMATARVPLDPEN
jgi:hypothetical protein